MITLDTIVSILIMCETAGTPNPNYAVHDDGSGLGCLGIQSAVIEDVNNKYDTSYTLEDRTCETKSREICKLYLTRWLQYYKTITGNAPTEETACRIWNGGPWGYEKPETKKYYNRYKEMRYIYGNKN